MRKEEFNKSIERDVTIDGVEECKRRKFVTIQRNNGER